MKHTTKNDNLNHDSNTITDYSNLTDFDANADTRENVMPDTDVARIMAVLNSIIRDIKMFTPAVSDSEYKGKIGITAQNQQSMLNAIKYAQDNPTLKPPSLDINDWINNINNYNVFTKLYYLIDMLHNLCFRAIRIFSTKAWKQFRSYYMYIEKCAEIGDADAQIIYDDIKKYYDYFNKRKKPAKDVTENVNVNIESDIQVKDSILENSKN